MELYGNLEESKAGFKNSATMICGCKRKTSLFVLIEQPIQKTNRFWEIYT
jgi:hypothetical protein